MPHDFLKLITQQDCNIDLPEPDKYGVAMCFLPSSDKALYNQAKSIITKTAEDQGHTILGWREVPTDGTDVGPSALNTEPVIEQLFLSNSSHSLYGKTNVEQQASTLDLTYNHKLDMHALHASFVGNNCHGCLIESERHIDSSSTDKQNKAYLHSTFFSMLRGLVLLLIPG